MTQYLLRHSQTYDILCSELYRTNASKGTTIIERGRISFFRYAYVSGGIGAHVLFVVKPLVAPRRRNIGVSRMHEYASHRRTGRPNETLVGTIFHATVKPTVDAFNNLRCHLNEQYSPRFQKPLCTVVPRH